MEEAMATWQTIDQVPAEFIPKKKPRIDKKTGLEKVDKENFLDKIYNKVFARKEKVTSAPPSSNAIPIPNEYMTDEVRAVVNARFEKHDGEVSAAVTEETKTEIQTDSENGGNE